MALCAGMNGELSALREEQMVEDDLEIDFRLAVSLVLQNLIWLGIFDAAVTSSKRAEDL